MRYATSAHCCLAPKCTSRRSRFEKKKRRIYSFNAWRMEGCTRCKLLLKFHLEVTRHFCTPIYLSLCYFLISRIFSLRIFYFNFELIFLRFFFIAKLIFISLFSVHKLAMKVSICNYLIKLLAISSHIHRYMRHPIFTSH